VVLPVGANPDMVTFTPNGRTVLVANEGEPNDEYTIDPEGSVSIVDLRGPLSRLRPSDVRTATFEAFEGDALPEGVRVFGPGASVSQDLEPEYVTVTRDGRTAYVSLQENNAIAVVDIRTATVTDLLPLGTKDHGVPGNELDPSDRDGRIAIASWPVVGLFQPDAIATYRVGGEDLIVTANEGDARDYDGFSEEVRVRDLPLCADAFPAGIQADDRLGRLRVTDTLGEREGEGCFETLHAYGARSMSIFGSDGRLVYDSGATYERTIAGLIESGELPRDAFNATNSDNRSFDSRSDDKGPEPEGVVLGSVAGRTYAFVGLERVGGVMVHDVTDPSDVRLVTYATTRDFSFPAEDPRAGDLGPEGLLFVRASDSPTGRPMLVVGNEVSGTTTLFDVVVSTR
jgi:2',3'-cyclic-nucleotide 2'-phosphodiesterase / 3'-nucleotidase / 5'-nucleotidase